MMNKEIKNLLSISKIYGDKNGFEHWMSPYKETIIIKHNKIVNRFKEYNTLILNQFRPEFFKLKEVKND